MPSIESASMKRGLPRIALLAVALVAWWISDHEITKEIR
jgi:hypothetical protein